MNNETKWRKMLYWLRKNFSAQYPITVRRVASKRIQKIHGDCTLVDGEEQFCIRINRNKSFGLQIDTLFHEWAHTLSWFGPDEEEDHTAEWGVAYARLYRSFLEWDWGREAKGESELREEKFLEGQKLLFN